MDSFLPFYDVRLTYVFIIEGCVINICNGLKTLKF